MALRKIFYFFFSTLICKVSFFSYFCKKNKRKIKKMMRFVALFRFIALLLTSSVVFLSCDMEERYKSILPADIKLEPGDVVFRLGTSLESGAVVVADRNGNYSHCGIVVDSCGQTRVVHAVPDEPDFDGDVDRVKMDCPEMFFRRDRASAGAVCRANDADAATVAAGAAKSVFFRHTLFDQDYDDTDTTEMYCSELINFSYGKAGLDLAGPERHSYSLIFSSFTNCIMPSQIYHSPHLHLITQF